ncbi:MAG: hypothetical protein R2710_13300 [Acidimicrobiales bacterium]
MTTEHDFEWPAGPEPSVLERPVFLEPGESLPALHYAHRDAAHHSAERSRRYFIATLVAIGHCIALLAAQLIAAGVERAHRSSELVRDGGRLLDDAFPIMVVLHLVAAVSVMFWASQRTPQRRAASLIASGALHCLCVAGWWTLYEMAA